MHDDIKAAIRGVPDFPKPGILFYDVTTLMKDPVAFKKTSDVLYDFAKDKGITKVAGIESRGFAFGATLAERLGAGLVLMRKPGKLPGETVSESYELEYGTDTIEMHVDAITSDDVVLLHDDLIATGGTAKAAANLIEKIGATIAQASFVIELTFLPGRAKLEQYDFRSVVQFDSE
jgi:adenine phosphoribosyltransferase